LDYNFRVIGVQEACIRLAIVEQNKNKKPCILINGNFINKWKNGKNSVFPFFITKGYAGKKKKKKKNKRKEKTSVSRENLGKKHEN
jgi:hypothetical protein